MLNAQEYNDKKTHSFKLEKIYIDSFINRLNLECQINEEHYKNHWDLTLPNGEKWELKEQRTGKVNKKTGKWKYTGNVVIEFSCSGKPSGINTTKATHWVNIVVDTNDNWVKAVKHKTEDLKDLIRFCDVARGGDQNRALMHKVPVKSTLMHPDYEPKVLFEMPLVDWEELKRGSAHKLNYNYDELVVEATKII